jgi:hypothetical protein
VPDSAGQRVFRLGGVKVFVEAKLNLLPYIIVQGDGSLPARSGLGHYLF